MQIGTKIMTIGVASSDWYVCVCSCFKQCICKTCLQQTCQLQSVVRRKEFISQIRSAFIAQAGCEPLKCSSDAISPLNRFQKRKEETPMGGPGTRSNISTNTINNGPCLEGGEGGGYPPLIKNYFEVCAPHHPKINIGRCQTLK